MAKDKKRSEAAKRGWETRRNSGKPIKDYDRSAAAKKGWRTRRLKQQYEEEQVKENPFDYFDTFDRYEYIKEIKEDFERFTNKEENDEYDEEENDEYDEEEYNPYYDEDLDNSEDYFVPNGEDNLIDLGMAIDMRITQVLNGVTEYKNMANYTRDKLISISNELGKQYYMNLSKNWSNIQGHLINIQSDYNTEKVYDSEVKLVGYAMGDEYYATAFAADLVMARRLDQRAIYHKRHPNASYRK